MSPVIRLGLIGLTLLSPQPAAPDHAPAAAAGLPALIFEIAVDSLPDVAVAVYTPWRGIIYYNPHRLRDLGPELSAFFRAHEYGHLYHHHTRAATAGGQQPVTPAQLRARELEADCYAAKRLAPSHRAAVAAAVHFFRHVGTVPLDSEHPDGPARAAAIERCLLG